MTNNIGLFLVGSTDDIDAESTGSTVITDTEDDQCHPMVAQIEAVEVDTVITPAVISIGTNSPNYDNIVPVAYLGVVPFVVQNFTISAVRVPANTEIKARVVTASIATAHKFRVALMGHRGFP